MKTGHPPADERTIEFDAVIDPAGTISAKHAPQDQEQVKAFLLRVDGAGAAADGARALVDAVVQRLTPLILGARTLPTTQARDVPIRIYVTAKDVMAATGCSRSEAYRRLRAAAGRKRGTRKLLRVPVDVWERYADHEGGLGR